MDFSKTNWIAVSVAAVGGVIIGMLWYALLFTDTWMAGNGITTEGVGEGMKMLKNGVLQSDDSASCMVFNFLAMVAYSLIMNWLLQRANITTLKDGAIFGAVIGVISVIGIFVGNMFAHTAMSLSMVDASYSLALFTFMGGLLGGWQKK
jgi:Protein of unknown function (DUF1761)